MTSWVNDFMSGVQKIFGNWTLLCLAVQQGWGGKDSAEKRKTLFLRTVDLFDPQKKSCEQVRNDPGMLADFLADQLLALFNTEVEDDSDLEVAQLITSLFNTLRQGDHSVADQIAGHKPCPLSLSKTPAKQATEAESTSSSEEDDGEIEN